MGSDEGASRTPNGEENATPSATPNDSTTKGANACERGGSWSARDDFAFEGDGDFARTLNALVRAGSAAPIAVSSHMELDCTWQVAFSAPSAGLGEGLTHPTTFAPMMRHAAGLWTAAPQSSGWLRIVDAAGRTVWLPLEDVTGSATYGESTCASLSAVRVGATIPASAGDVSFVTAGGSRTVRDLMGSAASSRGFSVRFAFSADMSR
ncbi:MAG: hypothetical protein ABW133_02485 [Polyangiaceae bacterium]